MLTLDFSFWAENNAILISIFLFTIDFFLNHLNGHCMSTMLLDFQKIKVNPQKLHVVLCTFQ